MMNAQEKLDALRALMAEQGIDAYIVPRADEYQGEFVAPSAERLKWLTEFTGSAGTAIVLMEKAVVMSDARYTIQLGQQADVACFETADSTKTPAEDWLADNLQSGQILGFDPYLHTPKQIEKFTKKNIDLKPIGQNLIDQIWVSRPAPPSAKAFTFDSEIAGQHVESKIKFITDTLEAHDATACLITLLDSIAWLLNVRGEDIEYIPSVQSRLLVFKGGHIHWFVDAGKVDETLKAALPKTVKICAPADLEKDLKAIDGVVLIDERYTPVALSNAVQNPLDVKDPSIQPKAIKSSSEIAAIRKAHIEDGIAYAHFLHWLKTHEGEITEEDIADRLLALRSRQAGFHGLSFPTIAGFGPNGAIIHYRASEKTNAKLKEGNMVLVDSGAQYYAPDQDIAGTTDITRTIAIGKPNDAMRRHYTLVLKGHIGLASARFPKTATGAQVDVFARQALWKQGIDYAHGTGHGVGCFLAVHEEASSLSPRGATPVKPGMLISNEPGYYEQGAYGIRIENLVLCIEDKSGMLGFETIGYAPFDKALIIDDMLDEAEKAWLDTYNQDLRAKILPHLPDTLKSWYEEQL